MIEQLQGFPENTVAFACHGRLTRADYEKVLIPAVDEAFSRHRKLRLYYEIDGDLEHVEAGAMWSDFKTGLEHWLGWERIAVVTDIAWIGNTISAFTFLMPGEVRLFSVAERDEAKKWITAALAA
ncbi:STAS/SEC14 domain-containing protein [Breoghania sp.]|uniref:STAS/SEC14 domain-containing protein n=1 Tax=Breoghania sp. TaxID=2065378 RepID=UPI002AAA6E28|nr:STAS/SEC14 domain-containing protein [Breoghania sp.]